ncbi:hypothetical protein GH714_017371 [Hevea brasiliensis]|uniref:Uncharacterized protein n=1 Tax=Hevea brasiliensis TaxID=3981 RepID=A0A6A6LY54_HEVBR|nr:hypothetical protein GH714_017371 [Hevea brasiliensis]
MGSSPRFPMYNNDFGWGQPLAIRSGRANKFDGKISAFPGREGKGSVDLEVVLAPETMDGLEMDGEFMQYVSTSVVKCLYMAIGNFHFLYVHGKENHGFLI